MFPTNNINCSAIVLITLIAFRLPARADVLCQFYINRNGLQPYILTLIPNPKP